MKSSVYDYLNDMDNWPDSYSFSAAEPGDVKRWKKSFDTRRGKTGAKWKKYAAAAAVLAIVAMIYTMRKIRKFNIIDELRMA